MGACCGCPSSSSSKTKKTNQETETNAKFDINDFNRRFNALSSNQVWRQCPLKNTKPNQFEKFNCDPDLLTHQPVILLKSNADPYTILIGERPA